MVICFYLFLAQSPIYSQNNYIAYYNLCNEGDEQAYLKNYPLAIAKYDTAFGKVDFFLPLCLLLRDSEEHSQGDVIQTSRVPVCCQAGSSRDSARSKNE